MSLWFALRAYKAVHTLKLIAHRCCGLLNRCRGTVTIPDLVISFGGTCLRLRKPTPVCYRATTENNKMPLQNQRLLTCPNSAKGCRYTVLPVYSFWSGMVSIRIFYSTPREQHPSNLQLSATLVLTAHVASSKVHRLSKRSARSIDCVTIYRLVGVVGIPRLRSTFYRRDRFLESVEYIYHIHTQKPPSVLHVQSAAMLMQHVHDKNKRYTLLTGNCH